MTTTNENARAEMLRLQTELRNDKKKVEETERELANARSLAAKTELLYRRQVLWLAKEAADRDADALRLELDRFNAILGDGRTAEARLASIKLMQGAS